MSHKEAEHRKNAPHDKQAEPIDVVEQIDGVAAVDNGAAAKIDGDAQTDAGAQADVPMQTDASAQTDAGVQADVPMQIDASAQADAPIQTDAGMQADAPIQTDAGTQADAPIQTDAEVQTDESAFHAMEEVEVYETSDEILRDAGNDRPTREPRRVPEALKTSGALCIICAVVALVVSFIHAITADTIAEATLREQYAAITQLFGDGTAITELAPLDGVNAVYAVNGGYCVNLDAKGFGGKINLMVGVNRDGSLRGVEIVSHSETPGFGAKADDPAYLSQYTGQGGTLTLGGKISAISGATITSKAVLAGVNAATTALIEAGLVAEYDEFTYADFDGVRQAEAAGIAEETMNAAGGEGE